MSTSCGDWPQKHKSTVAGCRFKCRSASRRNSNVLIPPTLSSGPVRTLRIALARRRQRQYVHGGSIVTDLVKESPRQGEWRREARGWQGRPIRIRKCQGCGVVGGRCRRKERVPGGSRQIRRRHDARCVRKTEGSSRRHRIRGSDAANAIKDRFGEGVTYARESFSEAADALPPKETMAKVQSSLSDLLERQPLVLGAIGLAVGVAVAGAFTASDLENEWVGEVSDRVKEDLKARAGAVSHSVREASDTLKAELGDIGSEAVDRLRETGRNAMNAARGKASA
ncbi:hypothetical protein Nham_4200 (plasmid) [Nitrobacter hamburgensis X14]|uniref:Nutrient deprivation-induced protein n=2 Tax=Nitrobacter hamburgensis TaxID=912 RepID=Q1QG24_NITHX|nr:hypothetical protein Nham_4200 [Nitrobacter hamburgensis X14]